MCGDSTGLGDERGGGLLPAAAHVAGVRRVVLLVLLAVVIAATGCVSRDSGRRPLDHPTDVYPGAQSAKEPYSRLSPARWKTAPAGFLDCASGWRWAKTDGSWRKALERHVVPLSREVCLVPLALSGDGKTFFASVFSPGYSGVVLVESGGSDYTPIRAFGDPDNDQAVGSFDGRWLVWYEYHSLSDFSDFSVWSWDSRDGSVRQIGAASPAPEGGFWPSSWRKPDARDGFATWTQGVGPDSLTDVHVVDLTSGDDNVVRHGHAGESFLLDGGLVAWAESPKRGALSEFSTVQVRLGHACATPRSLRSLHGAPGLVTDGSALAFSDPHWRSVCWSPTHETPPRPLFTSPVGRHVGNSLQVAGRYVGFTLSPFTYLADTKTRRYFQIGPGGWLLLDDRSMAMMIPSGDKAAHGIADVVFVPLSKLPPIGNAK